MDAKLKATWIALLRSGQKQCFGRYYTNEVPRAYCAVGLLREALAQSVWLALLHDVATDMAHPIRTAKQWNDEDRLSFVEIADRLEAMA